MKKENKNKMYKKMFRCSYLTNNCHPESIKITQTNSKRRKRQIKKSKNPNPTSIRHPFSSRRNHIKWLILCYISI